jgi:hypothetical protein
VGDGDQRRALLFAAEDFIYVSRESGGRTVKLKNIKLIRRPVKDIHGAAQAENPVHAARRLAGGRKRSARVKEQKVVARADLRRASFAARFR